MDSLRSAPNRLLLVLVAAGLIAAACTSGATPPPAGSSGSPTPSASSGPPTSGDAAVALVLATDPRFAGIQPQDPNRIGGCCFSTVTPAPSGAGYAVTIEIGWGDCPAGCINRHHWFYTVGANGRVSLDREDGPQVPAGVPASSGDPGSGGVGIRGTATAGPVCPVVRPGDLNCADRPVAGATIHILDGTGTEVAQLVTDAAGVFTVTLPPGRYRVQPDPATGLMGQAQPVDVVVGGTLAQVQLSYDTGIR